MFGVTQVPLERADAEKEEDLKRVLDLEDLRRWIGDVRFTDSFEANAVYHFLQRLFIYDPLDNPKLPYKGAWNRETILKNMRNSNVSHPMGVFRLIYQECFEVKEAPRRNKFERR